MSENKITFPAKLASNNPQSFGIADATEISGHKSVDTLSGLYAISDPVLSILKDGSDAIGQEWFVVSEDCKYRLDNWANRKSVAGWTKLPKQELINTKQSVSEKNQPNGYAGLDSNGKLPIEKTYGDTATVTEVTTYESLPITGLSGVIYYVSNTSAQYKWSGSAYIDITDGADNAKKNETSIFDCSNGTSTKYYSSLSDALNVVPLVYKTSNRIISYLSVEYPQVELIVNKAATVDGSISIYLDGVLKSTISVTAGMTAIQIADKLSDSTYVNYAPWSWTDSGITNKFTLTYGNNNIAKKITTYSYAADIAEESGLISFNILKEGFAPTAVNYQYHGIDSTTWTNLTKWKRIPNQADLAEIRSDLSEEIYHNYINVLNPDTCQENKNVVWDSSLGSYGFATLGDGAGYCTSDIIEVIEGDVFIFNYQGYNTNIDFSTNGITATRHTFTAQEPFNIPTGVRYMRYTFSINSPELNNGQWKTKVMLIKGNELPSEFLLYGSHKLYNFPTKEEFNEEASLRQQEDNTLSEAINAEETRAKNVENGIKKEIYTEYNNILNPDNCEENKTCGWQGSGYKIDNLVTESGYCITEKITVTEGETYIFNYAGYNGNIWYSTDGTNAIKTTITANEPFTIPAGWVAMRYLFTINDASFSDGKWKTKVMLIKGNELPSEFLPYGVNKEYNLAKKEDLDNLKEETDSLEQQVNTDLYDGPYVNVLDPLACAENSDVTWVGSGYKIDTFTSANGYALSNKIYVEEGDIFIFNVQGWQGNIWLSKDDISCSLFTYQAYEPFTIPAGYVSMRYRFSISGEYLDDGKWKNYVMLIKGSKLPSYYVEYGTITPKVAKVNKIIKVPDIRLPNEPIAVCLLNFDGINKPTFDFVAPYLHNLGLPFTVFTSETLIDSPEPVEGEPNKWSINDVIDGIRNYGMELGLYTKQTYETNNRTDNYGFQFGELQAAYNRLKNSGIYNIRSASYSGGIYTWVNSSILSNCFDIEIARTTDWGIQNHDRNAFSIKCKTLGNTNYASTIKADVDTIIQSKQCIAPLTHGLYMPEYPDAFCANATYNTSQANMKEAFDYIAQKVNDGDLVCMTFSQYVKWLSLPNDVENDSVAYTKLPNGNYACYRKNGEWEKIR